MATALNIFVHQYDCFDTQQPACSSGRTIFHAECIGVGADIREGRLFDNLENQFAKNGDATNHVVVKMDVEGAEWDSLLRTSDAVLDRIDQMAVEFHMAADEKHLRVAERLTRKFFVAHIHFNNMSCMGGLDPFPSWAFEVLLVSKRIGAQPASKARMGTTPQDAPNNPLFPDCQSAR